MGLDGSACLTEVRCAYAQRLKENHPEENPEGFQRLHDAYQEARRIIKRQSTPVPSGDGHAAEEAQQTPPSEPDGDAFASQATWDYQRLLSEGDQEADDQWGDTQAVEDWSWVDRALDVLYILYREHHPLETWKHFFFSGLFFRVKGNPEFLMGLEEFLQQAPNLEPPLRRVILEAYRLDHKNAPVLYRPLLRLLSPAAEHESPHTMGHQTFWRTKRKILAILLVPLLLITGVFALKSLSHWRIQQDYAQLAEWIQEDFQRPIDSQYQYVSYGPTFYTAADEPGLHFHAWRTGERDLSAGQPGYDTNLSNAMLEIQLERLEHRQGLELSILEKDPRPEAKTSTGVVYQLETEHASDSTFISTLDEMFTQLHQEPGVLLFPPTYTLELVEHGVPYYRCQSSGEGYDPAAVTKIYEEDLPRILITHFIRESGLLETDCGDIPVRFESVGTWKGRFDGPYMVFRAVSEEGGETLRWYFQSSVRLYSTPASWFDPSIPHDDELQFLSQAKDPYHLAYNSNLPFHLHIQRG